MLQGMDRALNPVRVITLRFLGRGQTILKRLPFPAGPLLTMDWTTRKINPSYNGPKATAAQDISLPDYITEVKGKQVLMSNNHVPVSIWVPWEMASQNLPIPIITKLTPVGNSAPIADQFIGSIVQTDEGPYLDGELWKNGENTGYKFYKQLE